MSQPNEVHQHTVYDDESEREGLRKVIKYLDPLVPRFTQDEFNQAVAKFDSYTPEQQQLDQKKCQIIKNYLKHFNIYIDQDTIPSLEEDPDRGPFAISMENTIAGKTFYYCPRFNKNGNLYIATNDFKKAMEVLSKPESLLLFR